MKRTFRSFLLHCCFVLSFSFMLGKKKSCLWSLCWNKSGFRGPDHSPSTYGNISVWLYLQASWMQCFQCNYATDLYNRITMPSVLSFFIPSSNFNPLPPPPIFFPPDVLVYFLWIERGNFTELAAIAIHSSCELARANLRLYYRMCGLVERSCESLAGFFWSVLTSIW